VTDVPAPRGALPEAQPGKSEYEETMSYYAQLEIEIDTKIDEPRSLSARCLAHADERVRFKRQRRRRRALLALALIALITPALAESRPLALLYNASGQFVRAVRLLPGRRPDTLAVGHRVFRLQRVTPRGARYVETRMIEVK
jgi:hypothetical protein